MDKEDANNDRLLSINIRNCHKKLRGFCTNSKTPWTNCQNLGEQIALFLRYQVFNDRDSKSELQKSIDDRFGGTFREDRMENHISKRNSQTEEAFVNCVFLFYFVYF